MSKRILVVEDQPDNRQIIRVLARTDYEITEAENGDEALAAIAKQRPDRHSRRVTMDFWTTRNS